MKRTQKISKFLNLGKPSEGEQKKKIQCTPQLQGRFHFSVSQPLEPIIPSVICECLSLGISEDLGSFIDNRLDQNILGIHQASLDF